ncbi:MAG: hypothetical protein ACKOKC_08985, partial [Chthoniobacterales bacterium]
DKATIGGGAQNTNSGDFTTIGGGQQNTAAGYWATIGGGNQNSNSGYYATIAGGHNNAASGEWSTIPGGRDNAAGKYAFAAGRRAKSTNDGAFVWADSTDADFGSTANNQFLIRAQNGVGINTNNPGPNALSVNGTVQIMTVQILTGSGDPNASPGIIAPRGSIYLNTTGGEQNSLWIRLDSAWARVVCTLSPLPPP